MVPIRPARGLVLWWLNVGGYDGITLPPRAIYVREDKIMDDRLIRHEEVHWEQYKRMGVVKFYALYIWYTLRYGYWANPMEVEARIKSKG